MSRDHIGWRVSKSQRYAIFSTFCLVTDYHKVMSWQCNERKKETALFSTSGIGVARGDSAAQFGPGTVVRFVQIR